MEPTAFHDWSILNALYQYFRRPELLACDVGVDLDTIADGVRTGRAECELLAGTVDRDRVIRAARLTYPRFPAPFNPMSDGIEVRKRLISRYSDSSATAKMMSCGCVRAIQRSATQRSAQDALRQPAWAPIPCRSLG